MTAPADGASGLLGAYDSCLVSKDYAATLVGWSRESERWSCTCHGYCASRRHR